MNRRNDLIIAAVILFVCILLLGVTRNITPAGAANYPRILLITMMVLAVALGAAAYLDTKRTGAPSEPSSRSPRPYLLFAFCAAYVALVGLVGYFIASSVFLFGVMAYLGRRSYGQMLLIIAGLNLAVWYVFMVRLNVLVPMGILFE